MASFDVPTTQSLKLGSFRGVDYVNSEMNVDLTRATEMRNFIHKDKINQKRNGFVQKAFIREDVSGDALSVNGHWEFTDSYGRNHTIIHGGNKIYKYTYCDDIYTNEQKDITRTCTFVPEYVTEENPLEYWKNRISNRIKDEPSFGIVRGDRLYILCGVYLVYGVWCTEVKTRDDLPEYKIDDTKTYYVKSEDCFYRNNSINLQYEVINDPYELRLVEDNEDTYVPVVTTGIAVKGSIFEGYQMSADEVNMLSTRRRVKLLGEASNSTVGYQELYTKAFDNTSIGASIGQYSKIASYDSNGNVTINSIEKTKDSIYEISSAEYNRIPNVLDIVAVEFEIKIGASNCVLKIPINTESTEFDKSWSSEDKQNAQNLSDMWVENVSTTKLFDMVEFFRVDIEYTYQSGYFYVHANVGEPKLEGEFTVTGKGIKKVTYALGTTSIDKNRPVIIRPLRETLVMKETKLTLNSEDKMADEDGIWVLDTTTGELEVPVVVESEYEGQMVLEVEYSTIKNQDIADKINGCKFGCMFGYNEAQQLFVSGNPDYPNMDWHTCSRDSTEIEYDLLEYEDLTYFGELSYASVGSPVNPIIGYLLLEDSTMAVLKEYNSNEPSLYLRVAYIGDAVDISGSTVTDYNGNTFQKLYYSMASSTIGEGCIAPKACGNLAGDKLFLSKNGIYALELNENIKSNERYAKERSRLVNNELIKEPNLKDAIAIVYQNRYYLALGTKIYIADARFKNQLSNEMTDTFSYEFYVWEWEDVEENVKITCMFIKNDELWFGTNNGRICAFDDQNNYVDKMYQLFYYGGGSITMNDNQTFTIASKYNLQENDVVEIIANNEEWQLGELVDEHTLTSKDIINNKIPSSFEKITYFVRWAEDKIVRATNTNCLDTDRDYIIKNVDIDTLTYELYDAVTNEIVDLPTIAQFTLFRPLEKTNIVHVIDSTHFKLKNYQNGLSTEGEEIPLYKTILTISKETETSDFYLKGAIRKFKNVVAYWYTPVLNMGTSTYLKTTQYLTVTPEAINNGNIQIEVLTRKKEKSFTTQGIDTLDLNTLRYTDYSFDISTFERAFSKKLKIKNFNFLQIFFKSDNDKNCIIKEICIDYILTKRSKGVK